VVAEVAAGGEHELVGRTADQKIPLLLRKAEAHHLAVAGERHVDDPAYVELHPPADKSLGGPRQRHGEPTDVIHGHHRGMMI
jgi:hypothetical protein